MDSMEALLTASSFYSEVGGFKTDCSIGLEHGKKALKTGRFKEVELELAKAEMTQVRDENARLKKMLKQIETDYRSLQKRFIDITTPQHEDHITQEQQLISLSLGRSPVITQIEEQVPEIRENNTLQLLNNGDLYLALDYKSHESSSEIELGKEEEVDEKAGEISLPSKVLKRTSSSGDDQEAIFQAPSSKRARVSVRARCDSSTMNDGCQWRKYGQKISKGNPCPRAYYRCTVAPGCPVRKQVQRCSDDMSILTTTYEGTHNHHLPVLATAMASTTSAAASMLLSGSSISATSPSSSQGINIGIFNNNNYSSPTSIYLPNISQQAFSTITLDLTTSSPISSSSLQTSTLPSVWGNGYQNYGTMSYNNKTSLNSQYFSSSYCEKSNQQILTETLTKAITSDPSLRSVINVAISKMASNGREIR